MQHIHTSVRVCLAAATAAISAVCAGATVVFPSAGRDIASADDWGGTLPGASDVLRFNTGATVTASNNVEFGGFFVGAQSTTVVLDMRDEVSGGSPRHVKMNGAAYIPENTWNAKYVLRGGLWDFGGNSVCTGLSGDYSGNTGTSAQIDGGAVVLCGSLAGRIGAAGTANSVSVIGLGTIVTAKTVEVAQFSGRNNRFAFSDGAKVVLAGSGSALSLSSGNITSKDSSGNSLRVAGGAALVQPEAGGTHTVGNAGKNNVLSVEDGGYVSLNGNLHFAYAGDSRASNSSGNRISVSGAGSSLSVGQVFFGIGGATSANSNNVVSVSDGAVLTNAYTFIRGHDNGFVISNATMWTTHGGIECRDDEYGKAANCFVKLQGKKPRLVVNGSEGECHFRGSFRFEYDIPEDGYETVPVTLNEWARMAENTEFIVNGIPQLQVSMRQRGVRKASYTLFRANNDMEAGPTDAMLERWNARLTVGATLSYASRALKLDVYAHSPMCLIIR